MNEIYINNDTVKTNSKKYTTFACENCERSITKCEGCKTPINKINKKIECMYLGHMTRSHFCSKCGEKIRKHFAKMKRRKETELSKVHYIKFVKGELKENDW